MTSSTSAANSDLPRQGRSRNPRIILWLGALALSSLLCLIWGLLPTLSSFPLLRVALFAGIGLSMLALVFSFPELSRKKARVLILGAAVFLRVLLLPAPVSDDLHRYVWEGQIVADGQNPFAAPADDELWSSRQDSRWEQMNHRDRPTAYPPGAQLIFATATFTQRPELTLKLIALAADLGCLILLLMLLRHDRLPTRWAGFYAFNPVVLIAFAAEAHYDSLMVAAILGSLCLARRGRLTLAFILLALAVQIKFVAIILAPLLLIRGAMLPPSTRVTPGPMRSRVLPLAAFALTIILLTLPFLAAIPAWFQGLTHFAGSSAFNGPLFTLLSLSGLTPETVRPICYAVFGLSFCSLLIARWKGLALTDSFQVALTLLLLCSPIVHFWYLAWLLPIAALRPSFGWTVASISIALYFLAWHTLAHHGWWGFGHTIASIIWLPALVAFAAQHRQLLPRMMAHWKTPLSATSSERIGIVIPTLDPGPELEQLVTTLREESQASSPIIIADASENHPSPTNATLLATPKGRGNQIEAGIQFINSDWILIAHADTTARPGWLKELRMAIRSHPQASMFILGQRFDDRSAATLLIELLNELRVVFGGVAFGDQTMVIRRAALEKCGGFPAQPLMEDVEASLRLHTRGRLVYLGREWTVSAAKWRKTFAQRFITVIRLVATYQLARLRGPTAAAKCSERLYSQYYKRPANSDSTSPSVE